jgi:PAS domain S-box-containing protein
MPIKAVYHWVFWLSQRRRIAFLLLTLLLTLSGVLLAVAITQSERAARERGVAFRALVALEQLLSVLRDAETGQRGYLLTGRIEYLEPYDSAVDQVSERLAVVRAYRPFPAADLDLLERQAREKIAELRDTVRLFQLGRRKEAFDVVWTDHGKKTMDETRRTVTRLQINERIRIEHSEARLLSATRYSLVGFLLTGSLTVCLLIGLIVAYWREEQARRAAEQEIHRQASRYAAINRAAPSAIVTADRFGLIGEWNPAATHIFGWTAEEMIGRDMSLIIPERYRRAHLAGMTAALASGHLKYPDRTWEFWGLRKDGTEFPAEIFTDVFTLDGVTHSIGIVRDITPRRHMEAQETRLRTELERSNAELQQFAYVASHDLQEPLRMIDKFVALLEEKYNVHEDKTAQQYMAFVREGAQRMRRLINDLLVYSRVTTKARPFEPVNLTQVLHEIGQDLQGLVERENGAIRVATQLPNVVGEAFQIKQLFQNLIANGLKFHRPDTAPVVTVACTGVIDMTQCHVPCWHFVIADNGIGIAPEQIKQLFQLFTRLHAREDYEGTGIGLAICKKIVDRHGGQIWIESTPGKGSIFHFTLPRDQKE